MSDSGEVSVRVVPDWEADPRRPVAEFRDDSLKPMGELLAPVKRAKPTPFSDPEFAKAAKAKQQETYRAKQAEAQRERRAQVSAVLGPASEDSFEAMESDALKSRSIEDMADMQVRRMARVVLLGGQAFAPLSLKEATDVAKTWADIAKSEAIRKGKLKVDAPEDETPAKQAAAQLKDSLRKLKAVQQKSG